MYYICSDIHGNFKAYEKVVSKLKGNDHLFILGDVIDRGINGIKILKDLMCQDNVSLILGNHEDMMIKSYTEDGDYYTGIWTGSCSGDRFTKEAFDKLPSDERLEILDWLRSKPVYHSIEINDKIVHLVHGSFQEELIDEVEYFIDYNTATGFPDYLWNSPFRGEYCEGYNDEDLYIHGHVPIIRYTDTIMPLASNNIIDIDGGLTYGGGLIVYSLNTKEYDIIQEDDYE